MASEEPAFLSVGTDVSAKYRGAFCEAKIKQIVKNVKVKVFLRTSSSSIVVPDEDIKGPLKTGLSVEVKHPDSGSFVDGVITKITDSSTYTVVFDDGDENTLRRTQLCLKGEKHFVQSETLDQLPLTHPEHFGTPVVQTKKQHRYASHGDVFDSDDDDDSSDDSSRKRTYRGRLQDMLGRVVYIEVEERKKTCSLPALVVDPNSDHLELPTREHMLVRSFKDSKFHSVARRDSKDFSKEMALKNEDKTLKTAYDRALKYLENNELPPNWDREELLGSESEVGSESESDDEPSEEKDHFVAQLYKFMDDRGTPINKAPTVGSRDLNLYKLFRLVQNNGGYNKVTNQVKWRQVYAKMGLPGANNGANQIKAAYKKYLHAFEDFYRKLGCTMGTITRPSRNRHSSGRSLLPFRDRESPKSPRMERKTKDDVLREEKEDKRDPSPAPKKSEESKAEKMDKTPKEEAQQDTKKGSVEPKKSHTDTPKPQTEGKKVQPEVKKNAQTEVKKSQADNKKLTEVKKLAGDIKKVNAELKKLQGDPKGPPSESKKSQVESKKTQPDVKKSAGETKKSQAESKKTAPVTRTVTETPSSSTDKTIKTEPQTDTENPRQQRSRTRLKELREKREQEERNNMGTAVDVKEEGHLMKESKGVTGEHEGKKTGQADMKKDKVIVKEEPHDSTEEKTKQGRKKNVKTDDKQEKEEAEDVGDESEEEKETPREKRRKSCTDEHTIGTRLRVKYGRGKNQKLYEAKVIEAEVENGVMHYLVHYSGWNTRYDEWVKKDRIVAVIEEGPKNNKSKVLSQKSPKSVPSKASTDTTPPSAKKRVRATPQAKLHQMESRPKATPGGSGRGSRLTRSNSTDINLAFGLPSKPKVRRTRRNSTVTECSDKGSHMSDSDNDEDEAEKEVEEGDLTKSPSPEAPENDDIDSLGEDVSAPQPKERKPVFAALEELKSEVLKEKETMEDVPIKVEAQSTDMSNAEDAAGKTPVHESTPEITTEPEPPAPVLTASAPHPEPVVVKEELPPPVVEEAVPVVPVVSQPEESVTEMEKEEEENSMPNLVTKEEPKEESNSCDEANLPVLTVAEEIKSSPSPVPEEETKGMKTKAKRTKKEAGKIKAAKPQLEETSPVDKNTQMVVEVSQGGQTDDSSEKSEEAPKQAKEKKSTVPVAEKVKDTEKKTKCKKPTKAEKQSTPSVTETEKTEEKVPEVKTEAAEPEKAEGVKKKVKKKRKKLFLDDSEEKTDSAVLSSEQEDDGPSPPKRVKETEEQEKGDRSASTSDESGQCQQNEIHMANVRDAAAALLQMPNLSFAMVQLPEGQRHRTHVAHSQASQPLPPTHATTAFDNTPPETPDNSPPTTDSGDHSPSHDDMSSERSERDASVEVEALTDPAASSTGGESPGGCFASAESNENASGSDLVTSHQTRQEVTTSAKSKHQGDEHLPKRRRRGHKRGSTSKSGHASKAGAGSDSDDPTHTESASTRTGASHSSPSKRVCSSSNSSEDPQRTPKPSKYNFLDLEDGKYLEGEQRILFLMEKIQDLRKIYMSLKAEVACIDRRRKRAKRREREAAAMASAAASSPGRRDDELS